jgi:ABC-type glycerol-3-phosphate transport system substrate-binding protein
VTVSFILPSGYERLYQPAIDAFKKVEPNITIQVKTEGFSQRAGDVSLVRWFEAADSIEEGRALDLTPFLQQERDFKPDDYLPGALATFQRGDQQFALPTGVDPFVIFYNQDLFDRLGVLYPQPGWTLDDFRTTALQISEPAAQLYGYGPSDFYLDCLFFSFQFGATLLDEEQKPLLDSPEMVQALEWYASLFGEGGVAPNDEEMDRVFEMGGRDVGVVTSKIGMWMGPVTSLSTQLGGMLKFKVGMSPLPRGAQTFSPAQFEGLMISAESANPQASWRWVSFLSAWPAPWIYPARISLAESEDFTRQFGRDQAQAVRAAVGESSGQLTGFNFGRYRNMMMLYFSAVRSTVDGGVPASEALGDAQNRVVLPDS